MRHRALSLALAGMMILSTAVGAFAQTVTTGTTSVLAPTDIRPDTINGFAQTQGVPSVASGTFQPQVVATDAVTAAQGTTLAPYITDLDAFFASRFGWRPSKPVTVFLYPDTQSLTTALGGFQGNAPGVAATAPDQPATFMVASQSNGTTVNPGDYVILVNTDVDAAAQQFNALAGQFGSLTNQPSLVPNINAGVTTDVANQNNGTKYIEESIARQYASMMIQDTSGASAPQWLQQGLADAIAFSIVPGIPSEAGRTMIVGQQQAANVPLPTLSQLGQDFTALTSPGGTSQETALGISFLGAQSLLSTVSGPQIVSILRGVGSGQSLDAQLQSTAGFNLDQLNSNIQSLIPIP
jgi:hypothetical protein